MKKTDSIDSNVTGFRFAEEASLKTLPASPVWYPLDPNSYSDFGGQSAMTARNPINPTRQRRKGVVTDLDASGGINQDITQNNLTRLLQGFMFADIRQKPRTAPMNGAGSPITGVSTTDDSYATAAVGFLPGALVLATGFGVAANNGLKTVLSNAGGKVTVAEDLVDEAAPPAGAALTVVGFEFVGDDASIVLNGALARLTSAAVDLTTLGLLVGEWVFLGGDAAGSAFVTNKGFARVGEVTSGYIQFDKTDWVPAVEAGAGLGVQMFFGSVLRNEPAEANIKRRTYDLERTLGQDADGTMSEHLIGAVANQLTLNYSQADKVTVDVTFVACDNEQRTGADGLKGGTRPNLLAEDAFNTANDFSRIRLATVDPTSSAPTPLFAFATDLTLTVNNNVSGAKALGVLGNFDVNVGDYEVGGSITAYFSDMAGCAAVRNNEDITIDLALVRKNAGLLFDIPLLSLGNGRLNVQAGQKIQLPLDISAAESAAGYTFLINVFDYLPNVADR